MAATAGEPPQKKTVDGAERQLAALGPAARTVDVVEQPRHLGGREVRVDHQPRLRPHRFAVAVLDQLGAALGGAAVLPNDRVVHRVTVRALPHDGGLALVGDADGLDLVGSRAGLIEGRADHVERGLPDLLRVVLDPTVARVELAELPPRQAHGGAGMVEQDGAGAGGALVDGENVSAIGHGGAATKRQRERWRGLSAAWVTSRFAFSSFSTPPGRSVGCPRRATGWASHGARVLRRASRSRRHRRSGR